ncbi:MAG: RHS repeat-associated core domain-containing protein [Bacteroidales bacterium]|nr:RHS repeat-associated core domain-containing protein [Bacteroidales bacterium]
MQDITYTYDKANNITQISNAAGIVNTLGDTYSYDYTYDSLYRLTYSFGSVGRGKPLANYTLNMQYEADGRITQKNQSGRTRLNGTVRTFNDSKNYTYNTSQPHTLQTVGSTNYQWDANGNMVKDGGAVLTWDEENRLKEVNKSAYGVCFLYDAGGERFYKNSGPKQIMLVNGLYYMNLPLYDDPVLYTSPYLVATPDGYTKHYFVESERFASRIGDGTITGLNTHAAAASALSAKQAKVNNSAPDSIMPNSFVYLRSLPFNWSSHHTTYWQHSDHLGSASWVTDTNGTAYQHLQYMPWGEPLLDQRKSGYTYNSRYTFSGKERDEETGYSYFGARHYNSALSIWLSVDPMADKYPSTSPYTYCANNPVRLVDKDGRKIDPWNEEGEKALQEYFDQFKRRTIEKAFGLTSYTKIATNPYESDYIEYASNIRGQSKEEFIANMGRDAKHLSETDLDEAFSVYLALSSEDAYVVGVWNNQQGAYTTSPETTGGTTVIKYNEGYRSHGLMKTNTDFCEDIKTNNYIKFDPSRNMSTSKNYFSDKFNFYYNFEWPRYSDIRGVFLFDLYQNRPINIGNAFNVTNNKVDIGL